MAAPVTSQPFASIADASARLRAGRVSPVTLAKQCLDRIAALDPALNAFITVTADLALGHARAAQRDLRAGHWRGPLHGIPVAVKDFYDTAGIRTTAGAAELADRVPTSDAVLVARLRDAGAVLVGKTNMHRLGMGTTSLDSHFGPVVNPWSADHVAGGSSGGSAVAVAAGLCFATVDTDAVGSGRLPAAICGVSCFKPTYGVLSTEGILAGEPDPGPAIRWLSHPCVTARTAADVALAFEALARLAGGNAEERHAPDLPRRIGVVSNFAAPDDARARFEAVLAVLGAMGLELRAERVPFEGASFDVRRIEEDRATIGRSLFHDVDVLVLPTLSVPTPTVTEARARGDQAVAADNTFFCNYYGLPAVSVACGTGDDALPIGVQFVGPPGGDDRVLALAQAYERAAGRPYLPPPSSLAS